MKIVFSSSKYTMHAYLKHFSTFQEPLGGLLSRKESDTEIRARLMEQYESTKRTVRPGSKKLNSLDRSEDQWKSRKIAVFGPQCAHTREDTQSLGCAGCPSVFFILVNHHLKWGPCGPHSWFIPSCSRCSSKHHFSYCNYL